MDGKVYSMIQKIDEGSFGDIFSVHKHEDKCLYALKQIRYRGNLKNDPYILQEIENLSRLKHENIVSLKDVVITPNTANIVMELAEGGNLENYVLLHGGLHGQLLQQIFRQILIAVDYCHQCSIAHRDLAPSNILLTDKLVVKVADFGLSMGCRDQNGDLILCYDYLGNVSYLAPEVILEQPHNAILADVWSIGVLLFFLICTKVPFHGDNMEILLQQQNIPRLLSESEAMFSFAMQPRISEIMEEILKIVPSRRPSVRDILYKWDNKSVSNVCQRKPQREFLSPERDSRKGALRQV